MSAIKTIIISRTDKIGDFVVSIPSFATAKAMYPEAKVIALVSKNNWMIAKNLNCVDECICIDHFKEGHDIADYLAQYHPDVFIALVSDNRISKLAKDCGASIRIGPLSKIMSFFHYNKGVRQRRSLCQKSEAEYNLDLVRSLDRHLFDEVGVRFDRIIYTQREKASIVSYFHLCQKSEAEYNLDLVRSLDRHLFDEVGVRFDRIIYTQREKASIVSYFHQEGMMGEDFILVNPFTGGSGSNLSITGYAQIIEGLLNEDNIRRYGLSGNQASLPGSTDSLAVVPPKIIIMGIEPNREACKQILSLIPEHYHQYIHTFINVDSLLVAAAMVDSCKVFIGPSTGITQIAGNYHKSAICFYSTRKSNSHTRWALYGDPNEHPVTLDLDMLDPNTKELKVLSPEIKEQVLLPALQDFYQK